MADSLADMLVAETRTTIAAHDMLPVSGVVLALVSGGADSVGMLRLLSSGEVLPDSELHVLHVNHLLRAEDSDGDEAFVAELCEQLNVGCRIVRSDVAELAEREGLNLEEAGRQVRYQSAEEYLDALCDAAGVPRTDGRIAVAHTRDDRIETFLMRFVQGSGATGLTSLRPVRGRIVRPLAQSGREDVRSYLELLGQSWREDASNADTLRLRARLRHEVLPVLRAINPSLDVAFERTIQLLADEDELLAGMGEACARECVECVGGEVRFDRACLRTRSRALQRRTVRAALLGSFPDASRLEFEHIEALVDGLSDDTCARDLPQGLRAFSEYGKLIVSRTGDEIEALAPSLLSVPGIADCGPAGRVRADNADTRAIDGNAMTAQLDADKVVGQLLVDSVRPGDRMNPLGMQGSKKVSDLLIDAKVAKRRRTLVPVVRDGESIVWLAGVRMSEEYKVTPTTARTVVLTWETDTQPQGS